MGVLEYINEAEYDRFKRKQKADRERAAQQQPVADPHWRTAQASMIIGADAPYVSTPQPPALPPVVTAPPPPNAWRQAQTEQLRADVARAGGVRQVQPAQPSLGAFNEAARQNWPGYAGAADAAGAAQRFVDEQYLRMAHGAGDILPTSPRFGLKMQTLNPLNAANGVAAEQAYSNALDEAAQTGPTGIIPSGVLRGTAGALGEMLRQATIITPQDIQRRQMLSGTPEQRSAVAQEAADNWQRWQTEQSNPLVDTAFGLSNPAYMIGPGEVVKLGKAGVAATRYAAPKIAEAARVGVAAARAAAPRVGEAAADVARAVRVAPEAGQVVLRAGETAAETANVPTFYSALDRAVGGPKAPNRASAEQWRSYINAQGVKPDEVKWVGVDDFLNERRGKPVTKQELADYVAQNQVQVQEVTKGMVTPLSDVEQAQLRELDAKFETPNAVISNNDYAEMQALRQRSQGVAVNPTKFSQYQLPGGESYRELLLTLPEHQNAAHAAKAQRVQQLIDRRDVLTRQYGEMPPSEARANVRRQMDNTENQIDLVMRSTPTDPAAYKSLHWDEPNVLAHVRFNTRYGNLSSEQNSLGEQLLNIIKSVPDIQSSLHIINDGVQGMRQYAQIGSAIIQNIPVNVVNSLRALNLTPQQLFRDQSVGATLLRVSPEVRGRILDGVALATKKTEANLRAKVLASLSRGLDAEVLPALRTSDLDTGYVSKLLSSQPDTTTIKGTLPNNGSALPATSNLGSVGVGSQELSPADITQLLDIHKSIVQSLYPNGKSIKNRPLKTLFIEEVQSDWHQAGREKGYAGGLRPDDVQIIGEDAKQWVVQIRDEPGHYVGISRNEASSPAEAIQAAMPYLSRNWRSAGNGGRVPAAPFSKTWPELTIKRMIRYASENGYDQIAWTTGKQQAARYDLAKQVKRINLVNPHFDESGNVTRGWLEAYTLSGQQAINREVTAQELPNIIGKEASDRLMNSPSRREGFKTSGEGIHILEGEGLTVGTQGMAGFYDTILPEVANKLGKKFGARVGTTNVGIGKINLNIIEKDGKYLLRDEGDVVAIFDNYAEAANALRDNRGIRTEVVHSLVITPQMKQAAMEEGFPLFSAPEIGGATVGGIAYQDDPNLSPQENLARRAAGVAAGGLAGYGARRLGMKSRLGGTVEDVGQGGIVKPLSASVARDVGNPNFQRWFSGSQVVDEAGLPKPVFRGDYRADLLGSKLEKKRATSGRFYFTEDPTIAGNYAAGKPDLALIEKNADYENWFKFPPDQGARTQNNLRSQWYRLSPEQQARVKDVMLKTGLDDSNNFDFTGANPLTGADHWNYEVRKARGNWLEAGKETWLNSGSLFGDEERFVDILEQAGLRPKFNSPYVERPGVTPVYLNIRRPLDTSSIPAEVVDRLMAVAKADRTRGAQYKWDQWDKNANAKVFMERLEKDLQEGTTFAWTSVPEKITQELQRMGYDGIKDVGGKMGGKEHAVWIAFEPEQVKSALGNKGTFNPDSANMLRSAPEIGGAIVGGLSADATTDPNATEGERWRNRLLGIIGGGALGYGGRRLGGISRLGGTLEDASNYIDDVARRFDEINTRLAEITPRLEQQANTDIRRAVSGKMRGTIQRPPNAGSLQNSQLEEIARTHDLNPYETAWWESLDPEALKEIGPGQRSSKLAAVQGAGDAAELKALNKEYMGLKAEMDRLTAEFDAGAEAALAKPANTPADVRQALGGLGSDMGRSIREADLREAEKQMVKLRVKNPQVTDEQAAQTSLGQQIARLRGGTGVQGAGVPDLPLSAAEAAAVPVPARSSLGAPPEPAASVPVEQRSLPSLSSSAAKAATGDLAKAAGKTLARAKGTPEQASALRPAEEGFAGNVKLSKFDEAGVSDVIKQTVDSPEFNQFAGQRRGVITDAQAVQNAADLTDPAKGLGVSIEDWLKSKPGRAFNQEEAIALGQTLAKTGQDYQNLLGEVTEARTAGTATSVMESQLADKALEFAALAAVRSGSAAEAGRTLRSFRTALTGEGASRTNAINEAFKHLGGTEQFTKWVEQFSQIDPSDKVAQYKMLQALYSPTLWDKINAWRYASMLSSWKTHFVNFSGNAGQAMVRPLTTALAGYPKEAAADVYGMMRGIPEAWAAAGDAFATGVSKFNVTQIETSQFGNIRPKPIGGLVGKVINPVSDVLTAADEFWKAVNYSGALHANAYRLAKGDVLKAERLLANPDKDMILQASEVAKYAVYQNDPGKFVNAFIRFANTPGPTGTVVKLIVPFIRTPANIYIRGLGMVLQPLAGPIKMGIKASKGDIRGVRMEAAKTLMASSVLAGLWGMVSSGNLTGQGPTNLTRRRVLEESGWQANSIKVPDPTQPSGWRWISYNNLGPLSVPMAFVAAVKEGLDEGRRPNHELALDVVSRVYNSMLDASFLRGVSDLFRAQNPATWATQNAASIAGSFVPYGSGLAAVERIVDPTIRAKDTPIAAVQGRIPFASLALPKEPSVYGGIRQTGPGDTIAQMIVPWQTSTKRPDPVAQEVARLTQAGTPVSVRQFSDTYAGAKQTPEQQRLLQGQAGKMAATYIADTISKSEYQVLDDQGKSATLNRMIGTAYDMADINLGNQVARDPRHQALIAWASVPHFLGVNGTPQEIQTQNYEISNAKALLSDYVQRYGQNEGKRKLFDANPTLSVLARRGELDGAYLKKKRAEVDKQFGGALSQTEQQGLVGASNTLVPVGGSR